MAKKITIPVTDHEAEGVCTRHYLVSYKTPFDAGYTQLPPITGDTIEIPNLLDDTEYSIHIVRYCCDGLQSALLALTVTTTTD